MNETPPSSSAEKACCQEVDAQAPCNCEAPTPPFPMDTSGNGSNCCSSADPNAAGGADEACCGAPPGPESGPDDRPGYAIHPFVEYFMDTPVGKVPRVKTRRVWQDRLGTAGARIGATRGDYKVAPGIYAVGSPTAQSPVLVSANYKLSFDVLRCTLPNTDAWLLVIDTRGINVWCAAGKALFGTAEVVRRILETGLASLVSHRTLVLPQLSATGVSGEAVKNESGFKVVWGPVESRRHPGFSEFENAGQ